MTARDLYFCIGELDDTLLEEAATIKRKPRWLPLAALAACAALAISLPLLAGPSKSADTSTAADGVVGQAEVIAEAPAGQPESAPIVTEEAAEEEMPPMKDEATGSAAVGTRILSASFGYLQLGQTQHDVYEALGTPDSTSNTGAVLYDDGFWRICWFYNTSGTTEYLHDLTLTFTRPADTEDRSSNWVLSELMASATCPWTLDTGLGMGSTSGEVLAAYPDAQLLDDGICSLQDGDLFLTFDTRTGLVEHITLGGLNTYHESPEPAQTVDPYAFTPYQTLSGETVTAYTRTADGWEKTELTGPQAKRVVVALNIMEPEITDTPCDAALWLIFESGGAAALSGEDGAAAIYHVQDAAALARALEANEDPSEALTLIEYCVFPEAWEEIQQAFTLPAQW